MDEHMLEYARASIEVVFVIAGALALLASAMALRSAVAAYLRWLRQRPRW